MNVKLTQILSQIVDYLKQDRIIEFKVGITDNLEERRKGYREFILSPIAEGDSQEIIQGEKDLIQYFKAHKTLKEKCSNEIGAGGAGQVENASIIYIAVRPNKVENTDLWEMIIMEGIPVQL